MLVFPLALTGVFVHTYGTLDCAEIGTEAVWHFRTLMIVNGIAHGILHAMDGKLGRTALSVVLYCIGYGIGVAWLLSIVNHQ